MLTQNYERRKTLTTRSKRWNGKFENLPVEYLKAVLEKMNDYGDRVQFSLAASSAEPSYQVINAQEKKIAFDNRHHLLRVEGDEFDPGNVTPIFTQEQVKGAIAGFAPLSSGGRAVKVARAGTRVSAAKLEEQYAAARYEYFRNNRQQLPAGIAGHTEEITELMKQGKSVEDAFQEVVRKYF